MKQSIYNSCLPTGNGYTLVYNAMTDKYAICNSAAITTSGHAIVTCADSVREKLTEIGAFVDDDADEAAKLARVIDDIDNDRSTFDLHINPTLNCNFRCWYCYEQHEIGSKMSENVFQAVLHFISRLTAEKAGLQFLNLSFFGGEPLMHFNKVAEPIIRHAAKECESHGIGLHVHFTTNAFLLSDSVLEKLSPFNVSFQITLDGARELHNKVRHTAAGKGSYDTILNNIRRAALAGKQVLARVNYTSDNIDSVHSIVDDMRAWGEEKAFIAVDMQRVWQDSEHGTNETAVQDTLAEIICKFRSAGLTCRSPYMHSAVASPCYGDRRSNLLINYNGDLFFCTARDFNHKNSYGRLQPDGAPLWHDSSIQEKRMKAKFSNSFCHTCRIAPICGGGCRQKAMELPGKNGCLHGFNDTDIDNRIIRRFEHRFALS